MSQLTHPVLQSEVRKGGEAASCQVLGQDVTRKSPGFQCSLQDSQRSDRFLGAGISFQEVLGGEG